MRSPCHRYERQGGREVPIIQRRYGLEKNNGYDYRFGNPTKKIEFIKADDRLFENRPINFCIQTYDYLDLYVIFSM